MKPNQSVSSHKRRHARTSTKTGVVLAAGHGKRLQKFETIKPLIKVSGKPLLVWALEYLEEAGVSRIYIVVGDEKQMIERELARYPRRAAEVFYVEKKNTVPKTMLGSLLACEEHVSGPRFVMVCDLIFGKNPLTLFTLEMFEEDVPIVLVSKDEGHNAFSGANMRVLHDDQKITGLGTSLPGATSREAGIYHFTEATYRDLMKRARRGKHSTLDQVFNEYLKTKRLAPVVMSTPWFDVNTPATLIKAELFLERNDGKKQKSPVVANQRKFAPSPVFEQNKDVRFEVNIEPGIIDRLEEYEVIPFESYRSPHYLIVDKNIDRQYGEKVFSKLTGLGYHVHKILVDPGEWSKSFENYITFSKHILERGIDKKSVIVSVGGGVIKDLAGFLASTLYRGIGFVSIPTTVLSQCDAAVALKQGVNGEGGKNLLGTFYAPLRVIVDPRVLNTLDERWVRDGLAECLKQAFAQDRSFYNFFKQYRGELKNEKFLEAVVRQSVALKVASIKHDILEEREALVNQYGHEVGHAVEYLSGYTLGHGESVAIGMSVSAEIAHLLGIASREVADAEQELLKKFGLSPAVPKDIEPEAIADTLRYNKKFHGGEARFVLVRDIGSLWRQRGQYTFPVPGDVLIEAIRRTYRLL